MPTVGNAKERAGSAKKGKRGVPVRRANEADENSVITSSGNVFADLGFVDAVERKAKADLAIGIRKMIEKKGWSQREAARRLQTSQPTISSLYNSKLSSITYDKLTEWCLLLGKSVRISVFTPKKSELPHLEVALA